MSIKYRLDDAASLKAGTIYFMRERDVLTANMSLYVKVGLIEASPYQDVSRRLAALQTGNPSVLSVYATIDTNLLYWVEALMHRRFAPERVNGEWFLFDESRIQSAVEEAIALANKANQYFPVVCGAVPLKNITSNGNIIAASSEAIECNERYRGAKFQVDLCNELELLYKTVYESLENRDEMPHVGKTQIIATRRFDLSKFILEYADL